MPAEKIELEAVESSMASAIGYNPLKQILAVQFKQSGTIKHYAGVSLETAAELAGAASVGRFLNTRIFNKYEVERMTGPCSSCGLEGWIGETCEDCGTGSHEAVPDKRAEARADDEDRDH